jgi:hypothetical protein
MSTINRTLTIQSTTCGECGILFGLEKAFMANRQDDGQRFYCPNGHGISWSAANEAAKTERELRNAEMRELALQDQLGAAIREGELTRQALLRDRQRFMNGVCVCCNRSFENVRRHMANQHPDYDVAKVATKSPEFERSCGDTFTTFRGLRIHQSKVRPYDWDKPNAPAWRSHLTRV